MEKKWFFILTTALATSLGVNATLLGGGVSEAQGIFKREPRVSNVTLTPANKSCFEACINSSVCPKVDAALGLTGVHACNAAKHAATFCIQTQRGNTVTDAEGVTTPAPDTMSVNGTSFHNMTLMQGKPSEIP